MKTIKLALLMAAAAFQMACDKTESRWMMEPDHTPPEFAEKTNAPEVQGAPKAEIVFVMDPSASMEKHINRVSANIDRFVKAFARGNPLEYRLAVLTAYDSRRYETKDYQDRFGREKLLGRFEQVKSDENTVVADKYFIESSDEDLLTYLKHTLKVKPIPLPASNNMAEYRGPQFEELFSPVAAAYGYMNHKISMATAKIHEAFHYGPDSYKIIFFVTDAGDWSNISPSELYYDLVAKSNGDRSKVMAFGAIIPSNDGRCARDPGQLPVKIEEFLSLARTDGVQSNVVSLCNGGTQQGFGQKFADFGKSIRERTAAVRIHLKRGVPVINGNKFSCPGDTGGNPEVDETLRLFYGVEKDPCLNQEIPLEIADGIVGFRYDSRTNSIVLNPQVELNPIPGAKLMWKYKAIDPINWRYGRVKRAKF